MVTLVKNTTLYYVPKKPHYSRPQSTPMSAYVYEMYTDTLKHTTHNHFTALLEFVRDHPGEQVPER